MIARVVGLMMIAMTLPAANSVDAIAVGKLLPTLRGEYLTGGAAVLPADASDRVALLMLGFTYDSRFQVEAWAKRFRQDFGAAPRVTFFEIPMIGGLAKLGKWFIDGGMRRGTPKADQGNVITVYKATDVWKQRVGFRDPKSAYLILIDGGGRVAWSYAGSLDEKPYQALSSEVSRLLAVKK